MEAMTIKKAKILDFPNEDEYIPPFEIINVLSEVDGGKAIIRWKKINRLIELDCIEYISI